MIEALEFSSMKPLRNWLLPLSLNFEYRLIYSHHLIKALASIETYSRSSLSVSKQLHLIQSYEVCE